MARARCWCGDAGAGSPPRCDLHYAVKALGERCGCEGPYVCQPHVFGVLVDQRAGEALAALLEVPA